MTALAVGSTRRTPGSASAAAESTDPTLPPSVGTERNRRVQHAGQLHVQAELGAAVDLARRIEPRQGLADQAKFAGILERHILWDRQLRGGLGQLPVARDSCPGR